MSGTVVEIAAPGGDMSGGASGGIASTLNAGLTTPGADSYVYYQGTSMAAPHVSGLASLILSVAPNLLPAQVAYVITSTALPFPVGSSCTVAACGAGIIDAGAAVRYADTMSWVDAVGDAVFVEDGFLPANHVPDPGEHIVVSLTIRNSSAAIPAASGTLDDGAPVSLGTLESGVVVQRMFTTTVAPALDCGGSFTSTLVITDSAHVHFALTWPLISGVAVVTEDFDAVAAPALPADWSSTTSDALGFWKTVTDASYSGVNSIWAPNMETVSDISLTSAVFTPTASDRVVQFRHKFDVEFGYDGVVLETSIDGGAFTDVLNAGGSFERSGYNYASILSGNPLTGRSAWSRNMSDWTIVRVILPAAAVGKAVRMRWRVGSDGGVGGNGYWLDNVRFPPSVCAAPGITVRETSAVSGGAAAATVVLNTAPAADVTIPMHVGDAGVTITPTSMLFTAANWNAPQRLEISADSALMTGTMVIGAASSDDSAYSGMQPTGAPLWAVASTDAALSDLALSAGVRECDDELHGECGECDVVHHRDGDAQ